MGQTGSRQEQFWEACSFGREWLVKQMIEDGVDVDWVSHIHDCCPIHVASQGKPNVVKMLLEAKCLVDAKDCKENTALHHAAMSGDVEIVGLLLDAGANIDASNTNGWTPLFNACYWNRPTVVELMLTRGADFDIKNKEGRSVIHELCRSKSGSEEHLLESLECLIACGIDMNQKSENLNQWDSEADFTPLLFATYHGYSLLVERILQAGGDLSIQDMNGWNALHWAAQRCHREIIVLLLKYGANIRATGLRGETAADATNDLFLRDFLSQASSPTTTNSLLTPPNYPVIISNGYVTTDEEDLDSLDGSSPALSLSPSTLPPAALHDASLSDSSSLGSGHVGHKPPVTLVTANGDAAVLEDEVDTPVGEVVVD